MPSNLKPPLSIDDLPDPDEVLGPLPDLEPKKRPAPAAASKRRPAGRSSTSSSDASGSKASKLNQIRSDLDQAFTLIGTGLVPFFPVTGTTLIARGPMGADIVCNIAAKDERVFRALLAVSKYAVYGELAMFLASIGVAATVDMSGGENADSFIVQRLVGSEIIHQVYGERSPTNGAVTSAPSSVPSGWSPQH